MESSGSQTSQPLGDGSDNPLVDLVDAQVAFDQDDARRLPCGNLPVLLPHAAVKGVLLLLEAGFVLSALFHSALDVYKRQARSRLAQASGKRGGNPRA